MGSDNLEEFHLWKEYKYILDNYKIIVLLRNGKRKEYFKEYIRLNNIVFLEFDFKLSSTEIRQNIKEKRFDEVKDKVNKEVLDYIKEYRLYE